MENLAGISLTEEDCSQADTISWAFDDQPGIRRRRRGRSFAYVDEEDKLREAMFRVTSRLRFIEPQLASAVDQPPEGKHWIRTRWLSLSGGDRARPSACL